MTADDVITDILKREGSTYTNHPADKGGPTKYGITLATLQAWRKKPTTASDVKNLTETEARAIYASQYVAPFDWINSQRLRVFLIDFGVNSGVNRAEIALQMALGVDPDGKIGPKTKGKLANSDPSAVFYACVEERLRLYGRLISSDPRLADAKKAGFRLQAENAAGWLNRVCEFL